MKMSIDDVIRYFKDMKKSCCCGTEQAIIAIEIMHKYKKIQEIYLKWLRDYTLSTPDAWSEIIEVIEKRAKDEDSN